MPRITTTAELGALIRDERKRQGLTQTELAQFSGVGINFVSHVERGKETAEIGKVLRLLAMLGLDVGIEGRDTWRRISRFIESDRAARHS